MQKLLAFPYDLLHQVYTRFILIKRIPQLPIVYTKRVICHIGELCTSRAKIQKSPSKLLGLSVQIPN